MNKLFICLFALAMTICIANATLTYSIDAAKFATVYATADCADIATGRPAANMTVYGGKTLFATLAEEAAYEVTPCAVALLTAGAEKFAIADACFVVSETDSVSAVLGADATCAAPAATVCTETTVCGDDLKCAVDAKDTKISTCQYPRPEVISITPVVFKLNVTASDGSGKRLLDAFLELLQDSDACTHSHVVISPANMANSQVRFYFDALFEACTPEILTTMIKAANDAFVPTSEEEPALLSLKGVETVYTLDPQICFNTYTDNLHCMAENKDCKIKCAAGTVCTADIQCGSSDCKKMVKNGPRICTSPASSIANIMFVVALVVAAAVMMF